MSKVDRLSTAALDLLHLVFVEDVAEISQLSRRLIPFKLQCWESELILLHIVVYLLVEILTHVCLKDDWEVVSEPFSVAASVESQDQCVQVIDR